MFEEMYQTAKLMMWVSDEASSSMQSNSNEVGIGSRSPEVGFIERTRALTWVSGHPLNVVRSHMCVCVCACLNSF